MNSKERILAAATGKIPDVLPVAPYMANHCTVLVGETLKNAYTSGKRLADAQIKAWEIYGQDVVVAQSDNYYMAEAFGCRIIHHDREAPTLEKPVIKEMKDVAKLKKPDPLKDGRMQVYLEAIKRMYVKLGNEVAIRGCGTGPFVMAGHLMGNEALLLEMGNIFYGLSPYENAMLDLLEIACETLIDFVRYQIVAGATIVQCADSTASMDMISPQMYEKYILPCEQKFFMEIDPLCKKYGAVKLLHICGDNTKAFHLYPETGADIVAVDHKADLAVAKRVMGERVCLIGNLDPSGHLLLGSAQKVETAVRSCIEKAASGGRYILGSGCEVPVNTPPENIKTMIRLAREYIYENRSVE